MKHLFEKMTGLCPEKIATVALDSLKTTGYLILSPEELDNCQKVWLTRGSGEGCYLHYAHLHLAEPVDATHVGRIVCVESIVREKCDHTVASSKSGSGPWTYCNYDGAFKCGKCGVYLKPTGWKEIEAK